MNTTDTPVEPNITGIEQEIIERFKAMEDVGHIARETGQAIDFVNGRLKSSLKKDYAARVKNFGPEGHS